MCFNLDCIFQFILFCYYDIITYIYIFFNDTISEIDDTISEIDDTITADIDIGQEGNTTLDKSTDTNDLEEWTAKRVLWPAYLIGFWGFLMLSKQYGKNKRRKW